MSSSYLNIDISSRKDDIEGGRQGGHVASAAGLEACMYNAKVLNMIEPVSLSR